MSQNKLLRNIDTKPDSSRLMDKIHTRSFKGYFRRLRILGGALLFTLYFGTIWLTSGDRQAVLWNLSELKILNKGQHSQSYNIGVSGVDGLQLSSVATVSVGAGERVELPVTISVAPESLETEVSAINFHLQSVKDPALKLVENSKFMGTIR
ncbi:FixG Ig-like domain-containing protein [Halomonas sp. AOP13-D3-9]